MGPLLIPVLLILLVLVGGVGGVGLGGAGVVLLFRSLSGRTQGTGRRIGGALAACAMLATAFGCVLPFVVAMVASAWDIWGR